MKLLGDARWWLKHAVWAQIDRVKAWYLAAMECYEDEFD